MKIVIITDGNSKLGMGHVYQSITLARTLLRANGGPHQITILSKSEQSIIDLFTKNDLTAIHLEDDNAIFNYLQKMNPDRVIFDKLDVAPALAKRIKQELNKKLVIFTNLTSANEYADMTVMAGMGSDFKNIHHKVPGTDRTEFWGPKYWLLRPEFYGYEPKEITFPVRRIMLIFGGADQANLSSAVLEQLLIMQQPFHITLVLGAAFPYHNELNRVLENNKATGSTVEIIRNLSNVAETMYRHDLVCVSPGLSFFEALSVGTPVLCFHQNKFQEDAWKGHIQTYDIRQVDLIPDLLTHHKFIFPYDDDIRRMEIGKGLNDMVEEILN